MEKETSIIVLFGVLMLISWVLSIHWADKYFKLYHSINKTIQRNM